MDLASMLEQSSFYEKNCVSSIVSKLIEKQKDRPMVLGHKMRENPDSSKSVELRKGPGDAWTSIAPSFVDISQSREYYSEFNTFPEYYKGRANA